MKENSPFTPGTPVPLELFVGRSDQIDEMYTYLKNATNGHPDHIFLIGDRGIGKSSLAKYVREIARTKLNMMTAHVHLGTVKTIDELVIQVFNTILKESYGESWFDKIKSLFGDYVKAVGFFDVGVEFHPPSDRVQNIRHHFHEALNNIIIKLQGSKNGLLIILDDINGLTKTDDFANWYKSFADHTATHYTIFPVVIMVIGLKENREALSAFQPSLLRIFRVIIIEKLLDDQVNDFLTRAFKSVFSSIEVDALAFMAHYSSGLPIIMHEIGDSVYQIDTDNMIRIEDATAGVVRAANRIGNKYIDPTVYDAIQSEKYLAILRKIGEKFSSGFTKDEIEYELDSEEKRVFHNFLAIMKKKGILIQDPDKKRGGYKFINELYGLYIALESYSMKKK